MKLLLINLALKKLELLQRMPLVKIMKEDKYDQDGLWNTMPWEGVI